MDIYTLLGILAIIFWSSNVAFSRSLAEQIGPISSGALTFTIAGILACLYVAISTGNIKNVFNLPKSYLVVCGSLFVTSTISLSLAVGFSIQREQVLTVGLINYLWPGISLFLSVLLWHRKANIWLFLGILSAFAGIWISTMSSNANSLVSELLGFQSSLPFVLALIAAFTWGLYSNISRKWSFQLEAFQSLAGVPLFLLAAGLILACLRVWFPEKSNFSINTAGNLAVMVLFPSLLAYIFWDLAARRGDLILISSLSFFIPILSTLVTVISLKIPAGPELWIGAFFVTLGAIVCKYSIQEKTS